MFDLYDLSNPQLYTDSKEIAPKERKNLSSRDKHAATFLLLCSIEPQGQTKWALLIEICPSKISHNFATTGPF